MIKITKYKRQYSVGFKMACEGTGPSKVRFSRRDRPRKPQFKSIEQRQAERDHQDAIEEKNKIELMQRAEMAGCPVNELHNKPNRWATTDMLSVIVKETEEVE